MKTLASLLLISASLTGTAALAHEPSGELDYPPTVVQTSSLTRAEVIAELHAARAAGQITFGESEEPVTQFAASHRSRADVQAEAAAARTMAAAPSLYVNTGA